MLTEGVSFPTDRNATVSHTVKYDSRAGRINQGHWPTDCVIITPGEERVIGVTPWLYKYWTWSAYRIDKENPQVMLESVPPISW